MMVNRKTVTRTQERRSRTAAQTPPVQCRQYGSLVPGVTARDKPCPEACSGELTQPHLRGVVGAVLVAKPPSIDHYPHAPRVRMDCQANIDGLSHKGF